MLPTERRQHIVAAIKTHGIRSVGELSAAFDVSEMTIRRDLARLEAQGFVTRTYGGAVPGAMTTQELRFVQKQGIREAEKRRIARYAVEHFVTDGAIINLEGGTTVAGMVPFLAGRRQLTIMTNGLHTLFELQPLAVANTVISTGGILRGVSNTLVGPVAEEHFHAFNAQSVFVSATGWTAAAGFTDPNVLEIEVKKGMIRSAAQIIVLLDSSKFGQRSLTRFLDPAGATHLVTDSGAPADVVDWFSAHGVQVHVAR